MEDKADPKPRKISVETFTGDMVKVIESGKGGLIKKIIHEEEKHEAIHKNISPDSARNKIFMLLSSVLVLLAILSLAIVSIVKDKAFPVTVKTKFIPLIFTDKNDLLPIDNLSKEKIPDALFEHANSLKIKQNGIDGIFFTKKNQTIGLKSFMGDLSSGLSLANTNPVVFSDTFMVGIYNKESKPITFFILKVRSFSEAFPLRKDWEKKMFNDLNGFFGFDLSPNNAYLLTKDFEDGIIYNKNARILYKEDGTIALMYIYADENSIVITNDSEASAEVINRLTASKIRK